MPIEEKAIIVLDEDSDLWFFVTFYYETILVNIY